MLCIATGASRAGDSDGSATRSGKRIVFQLVVNNVPITSLDDVLRVFQDQGAIAAMLWRDN